MFTLQQLLATPGKDKLDAAAKIFVGDCIACGSCAWACPSHIPLLQYFNHANGALWTADKLSRQEQIKTLRAIEAEFADDSLLTVQLFSSLKKQGVEQVEDVVGGWFAGAAYEAGRDEPTDGEE